MPRFMMIVVANAVTEAEAVPGSEAAGTTGRDILEKMGKYNEELMAAGILVSAEGLQPTSKGYRLTYSATNPPAVTQGPFDVTKQGTISGYWFLKADNVEIVLDWARKIPFSEGQVEVRRVAEPEDFGDALSPELKEKEKAWREQLEKK